MKHLITLFALIAISPICMSQQDLNTITKKGRAVYLSCDTSMPQAARTELTNQMAKWGYWAIEKDSAKADFLLWVGIKKKWDVWANDVLIRATVFNRAGKDLWHTGDMKTGTLFGDRYGISQGIRQLIDRRLKERFNTRKYSYPNAE